MRRFIGTVLPKEQLIHVLKKQGFRIDDKRNWRNKCGHWNFLDCMFRFSLEELELTTFTEHPFYDFIHEDFGNGWLFHKDWFIPKSLREIK